MKFSEMLDLGPPTHDMDRTIMGYIVKHCPQFIAAYTRAEFDFQSVILGMDTLIKYIQVYGMPDDLGEMNWNVEETRERLESD